LIPAGKTITREDLTWKRPAHGISPKDSDQVLGRTAARDILEDEILLWTSIK
jgi:sialic acid synthase SpsE